MIDKDNEASHLSNKFESEVSRLGEELNEMKEMLISFQDKHKQIEQHISILENEMDEKIKLKALNKDEEAQPS